MHQIEYLESYVPGDASPPPSNVIYTVGPGQSITSSNLIVVEMPVRRRSSGPKKSLVLEEIVHDESDTCNPDLITQTKWKPRNSPRQSLECTRCNNTYKNSNHLRRHVQYECGKPAAMVCLRCNARFKRPDSLRRHVQESCQKKTKTTK